MLVYDRVLIGKVMLNLTVGTATAMPHANMFLFLFLLINFNFLVTFLVTFISGRGEMPPTTPQKFLSTSIVFLSTSIVYSTSNN